MPRRRQRIKLEGHYISKGDCKHGKKAPHKQCLIYLFFFDETLSNGYRQLKVTSLPREKEVPLDTNDSVNNSV